MRTVVRSSWFILLLALGLGAPQAAKGQEGPLHVDGVTVGLGLSLYQGDLDANPGASIARYFTSGSLSLLVSADRQYGAFVPELVLHYNRFTAQSPDVRMRNNLLSLDATGSYRLKLIRPDLLRVFLGVGPTLLLPSYDAFPDGREGYRDLGTRAILTFSAGVVIQDRVRIGTRITATDFLDGAGTNHNRDYVSYINIGYRFKVGE